MTELTGRTYNFEVSIELNDALSFVPGELGTYLAEALFELDRINLLFPGLQVPEPGERIFSVSIQQMGYARGPCRLSIRAVQARRRLCPCLHRKTGRG